MRISLIVVLYNRSIESIACLNSAISDMNVTQIIICDNSVIPNKNDEYAKRFGLTYIDMDDNRGLSTAYNAGVLQASGDVICFFDDDTIVCDSYFKAVSDLYEDSDQWDIALPLVKAGDIILSPCKFRGFRVTVFTDTSQIVEFPYLSGINSGMVVRHSVFSKVSYDENLFLDFVDHKLIADARQTGLSVVFLRGPVLQQNFSLITDTADAAANRLSIFLHDARVFYSKGLLKRIYCELIVIYRKVRLCCKYKSLQFLCVPKLKENSGEQ
jgi:rhamnosyltransferase